MGNPLGYQSNAFLQNITFAHLLVLLLAFAVLSATTPTPDAAILRIDYDQSKPRLISSPPTMSHLQYVPKHSPVARDLYELPNGWVRIFLHTSHPSFSNLGL